MEFHRITTADSPVFSDAMRLYAVSFPKHEQREEASQNEIMSNPAYHFDVVCDAEKLVGEILYWEIGKFYYVEHFCVHPDLRGQHYGQRILEAYQDTPMILEIDPLTDSISRRRKKFYERCGFTDNSYAHVHPPYHAGNSGHPLIVMSSPDKLTEEEYVLFRRFLEQKVMKNAY
ncbi:MAG: GNAT family N-acetyltransferase [Eubacterium sp.]